MFLYMTKLITISIIIFLFFANYNIQNFRQVVFNEGFAIKFNNGKAITALHLVKNNDKLVYLDKNKDIAVIELDYKDNSINLNKILINDDVPIILINKLVQNGDSGKVYIVNGKLMGIIIGRQGEKAVVSTISSEVVEALKN